MIRRVACGVLIVLALARVAAANPPADLTGLPTELGLPLVVHVAVVFVELRAIDDRAGAYNATIDVRLRWRDMRLRDPGAQPGAFIQLRGAEVDKRLAQMWSPDVGIRNQIGEPTATRRSLRSFPNGDQELLQRITAQFATAYDLGRFPFDHQQLRVELVSRRERNALVALEVAQDDLALGQSSERVEIGGWSPVRVDVKRAAEVGWYGEAQDGLLVTLEVARRPGAGVLAIFIPLFAVLMIPILALWLNRIENGEFKVGAVDLTNILLGGLFAVIALNFTIGSAYPSLMTGDNTITRLLGLVYLTLGATLLINITLFRFGLAKRWFGRHVQEQLYRCLAWALPCLTLATALAIVLASTA